MKFTTPCFIRKNTPELRKKLEGMGYERLAASGSDIMTMKADGAWYYSGCNLENIDPKYYLDSINCGTNEALFLALAALREDSDYMQWFTDGKGCFVQCLGWFWSESMPEAYIEGEKVGDFYSGFRKATILELCEHFPNNISN